MGIGGGAKNPLNLREEAMIGTSQPTRRSYQVHGTFLDFKGFSSARARWFAVNLRRP
jgi:hypothetical protein